MSWVKHAGVGRQVTRKGQILRTDGLHDAAREFVGPVGIVMRAVASFISEREGRATGTKRFVESRAHGVKIDQWNTLLRRDRTHGVGIGAMRIGDAALRIEGATLHRGYKHGKSA